MTLELEGAGKPIAVASATRAAASAFTGWLGLIAAIDVARALNPGSRH